MFITYKPDAVINPETEETGIMIMYMEDDSLAIVRWARSSNANPERYSVYDVTETKVNDDGSLELIADELDWFPTDTGAQSHATDPFD